MEPDIYSDKGLEDIANGKVNPRKLTNSDIQHLAYWLLLYKEELSECKEQRDKYMQYYCDQTGDRIPYFND